MRPTTNCEQCGAECRGRFCSDKCSGAWHREHDPDGVVKTVRRLARGGSAVVVHFGGNEAERALHLRVGERVVLGAIAENQSQSAEQ